MFHLSNVGMSGKFKSEEIRFLVVNLETFKIHIAYLFSISVDNKTY